MSASTHSQSLLPSRSPPLDRVHGPRVGGGATTPNDRHLVPVILERRRRAPGRYPEPPKNAVSQPQEKKKSSTAIETTDKKPGLFATGRARRRTHSCTALSNFND